MLEQKLENFLSHLDYYTLKVVEQLQQNEILEVILSQENSSSLLKKFDICHLRCCLQEIFDYSCDYV